MNYVTEPSELQSALPVPDQKLNTVMMCVVTLMVPILSSAEHMRNTVRFIGWNCMNI
jgi:hypothetical protein